jgi:DNA-directed RNA polymerase specialized sigma24 family protein
MKATEIAAELGVAEGTVHAQLHTARGKLIAGLERYYPFGEDGGKGARS